MGRRVPHGKHRSGAILFMDPGHPGAEYNLQRGTRDAAFEEANTSFLLNVHASSTGRAFRPLEIGTSVQRCTYCGPCECWPYSSSIDTSCNTPETTLCLRFATAAHIPVKITIRCPYFKTPYGSLMVLVQPLHLITLAFETPSTRRSREEHEHIVDLICAFCVPQIDGRVSYGLRRGR